MGLDISSADTDTTYRIDATPKSQATTGENSCK